MVEIKIPFNEWSRDKLRYAQKTCTSRSKRYGYEGDTFQVDWEDGYAIYQIDHVVRLPLWLVSDYLHKDEGAPSTLDFKVIWEKIHPQKGFRPDEKVFTHFFSLLSSTFKKSGEKHD